jgi:hypothetical protein
VSEIRHLDLPWVILGVPVGHTNNQGTLRKRPVLCSRPFPSEGNVSTVQIKTAVHQLFLSLLPTNRSPVRPCGQKKKTPNRATGEGPKVGVTTHFRRLRRSPSYTNAQIFVKENVGISRHFRVFLT